MTMKRARWLFLVFLVLPILACRPYSGEGVTSTVYVAPTATLDLATTKPATQVATRMPCTDTPRPTQTEAQLPTATISPTPEGPCTLIADFDVDLYIRPSTVPSLFGVLPTGLRIEPQVRTADGWFGFDPAVA